MPSQECSIDACARPARKRGWCDTHYQRWRKWGTTDTRREHFKDPGDAIRSRVERVGECLIWTGAKGADGYGLIRVRGKVTRAHRYAWELARGEIGPGVFLDHSCGNRACIELAHLRIATQRENNQYRTTPDARNKSGYRGVFQAASGRWVARAMKNGKLYRLGTFDDAETAGRVASEWRSENYRLGEFDASR